MSKSSSEDDPSLWNSSTNSELLWVESDSILWGAVKMLERQRQASKAKNVFLSNASNSEHIAIVNSCKWNPKLLILLSFCFYS